MKNLKKNCKYLVKNVVSSTSSIDEILVEDISTTSYKLSWNNSTGRWITIDNFYDFYEIIETLGMAPAHLESVSQTGKTLLHD